MTLEEILAKHGLGGNMPLRKDLLEREDAIADQLRVMGMNLGAMPEFVAQALVEVGLGTPPSPEEKTMIAQQFSAKLAWLQEEFRRMEGGGTT